MPKGTRRAPDWGANEEIALRVSSYRPQAIDEHLWVAIRPFVLACASALPLEGWASATRTLRVLAQIGLWAEGEGIGLDQEVIFDPDTVERFVTDVAGLRCFPVHLPSSSSPHRTAADARRHRGSHVRRLSADAMWPSRTRLKSSYSCPVMLANNPLMDSAGRLVPFSRWARERVSTAVGARESGPMTSSSMQLC